jgi:hypothetical protein
MHVVETIKSLFAKKTPRTNFLARQLMFNNMPMSYIVENYLHDNERKPQKLDNFPMIRYIYDNFPDKLLLKCSRKTLKSTILSNTQTVNMIKWNDYHQMYVANLERSAKNFSSDYFVPRFNSPKIKEILSSKIWEKDDVFKKVLADTLSSTLFTYCSEDASRTRGPSTHENFIDEIQEIEYSQLPIINETMSILGLYRQRYAGTPLGTSNSIEKLWTTTNQCEWMTKCTACNHWNYLDVANDPLKMILEHGYSCSKCSKVIDTSIGEWVAANPNEKYFFGFHLAQPMLPHYNRDPESKAWQEILTKLKTYDEVRIFNEVLGLSFDSEAVTPITEPELRAACVLGPMYDSSNGLKIYNDHRLQYRMNSLGADWGVNGQTSRTVGVLGGIRGDGVLEIYWMKNFRDFKYSSHIEEMAVKANAVNAKCGCDSGPDPDRGIRLAELTMRNGNLNCNLIRYEHGKVIQRYDWTPGSDWRSARWVLHRSDTIGLMFKLIKQKRILFPRWEDCSVFLQDLLNEHIEIREGLIRQEQFYRRKDLELPDDFVHAINYCAMTALADIGDGNLTGVRPSSSAE